MSSRKKYPPGKGGPETFLDNDEIKRLLDTRDAYKFKQEDWIKLLNCVHCNERGTSEERAALNEKFLKDGNEIPGLEQMSKNFLENGTPYKSNKMRIKRPEMILIHKGEVGVAIFGLQAAIKRLVMSFSCKSNRHSSGTVIFLVITYVSLLYSPFSRFL
ncbi:MAG: hypothetical protein ACTSYS_15970 [Promethearchaeota archaeon]